MFTPFDTTTPSIGGLLVMNILPWPHLTWGVLVIRVVECPTLAMFKKLLSTATPEGLQSFPRSQPYADRSIWAHGNGGHLHARMIEYAMFGSGVTHPVVELNRRIQAGTISYFYMTNVYSSTLPLQHLLLSTSH